MYDVVLEPKLKFALLKSCKFLSPPNLASFILPPRSYASKAALLDDSITCPLLAFVWPDSPS